MIIDLATRVSAMELGLMHGSGVWRVVGHDDVSPLISGGEIPDDAVGPTDLEEERHIPDAEPKLPGVQVTLYAPDGETRLIDYRIIREAAALILPPL